MDLYSQGKAGEAMNEEIKKRLRQIPKVDVLLSRPALAAWERAYSRRIVRMAVQAVLASVRSQIMSGGNMPQEEELEAMILEYCRKQQAPHLKRVINATGTVLHTNLGRAVLSEAVARRVEAISCAYSNLEYNLEDGSRGSRYDHLQELLKVLTGAEAALVVNNNAAAVLLVLTVLAKGREVIISRGELVEIGGLFRIPDVIEASGSLICEVGTTNKTHLADYSRAIHNETGAIMKVHTSNYRIIGFAESVPAEDLAALAHSSGLPFIQDLGSGLFVDMRRFGLPYEPTVREALHQGCDIVTFSGDKLLGGPQAGLIVGKAEYIEKMKQHQLLRALRVDKMTLAALEATLQLYTDEDAAVASIPVLRMLAQTEETCRQRAGILAEALKARIPSLKVEVQPVRDVVGGGAYPEYTLPGYAAAVQSEQIGSAELECRLRHAGVPIILRVQQDRACMSVRTLRDDEFSVICEEMAQCVAEG